LVVLATVATVIASQAVITGTFSLASQAIQFGLLPRLAIFHTSDTRSGQIYVPQINALLLVGVVILVLEFGTSSMLASAYGISVTGEIVLSVLLLLVVMRRFCLWPLSVALLLLLPFFLLDTAYLVTFPLKIPDRGRVSVAIAAAV